MSHAPDLQLDWDVAKLHRDWPNGADNRFLLDRLASLTVETTLAGSRGRVLDVAAAEASHACAMSARGAYAVALDPSPAMLGRARARMAACGASVALVRGIAETLPFRAGAFDRVLCHGAIDHVAEPDLAVREMTRVLAPGGRLVIGAVNYAGASVRLSRLLYRAGRRLGLLAAESEVKRFWDSPVPIEHTFECTYSILRRLCDPYLELDRTVGVSIGWMVPGWGALLERLPAARAAALLERIDRLARRAPALADYVFTVWRPRPPATRRRPRSPHEGGFAVQPNDLVYPRRARGEAAFWDLATFAGTLFRPGAVGTQWANTTYTGDPARSWLDDLIARGPFRDAALLGCDEDGHDVEWLRQGGSERLDVYDLSPHAIRKVRARLGPLAKRVRFVQVDLNFAELPAERYDVIWSSGCLHHLVNLEHLYAQVERALRPGGLFGLHDYVGERRMRYTPQRLARVNALLREVPERFRLGGITAIAAPADDALSPFCGVRSDDVLPLAAARFARVHEARFGALFPLPFTLDFDAIAREDPALLARLTAAEEEAQRDPALRPCSAYAVFRKH